MKPLLRCLAVAVPFLLLVQRAAAQTRVVDTYTSQPGRRARLGGGELVLVDTAAGLSTLLKRLNQEWELVETGKTYWIGYTDDMYAIATYGEAAVAPLLALARSGAGQHTRFGAIYSLHLIGIQRRVAGRFVEDFMDVSARQALRSLVADPLLGTTAIELLMRDPWQSDVPVLLAALAQGSPYDWALLTVLQRYQLPGLPLYQPLSEDIGHERLAIPAYQWKLHDAAAAHHLQNGAILAELRKMQLPYLVLESGLEAQVFTGHVAFSNDMIAGGQRGLSVRTFLEAMTETDYCVLGSELHYFTNAGGVTVCSTTTARQRVLAWWQAQPASYRQQFSADKAK